MILAKTHLMCAFMCLLVFAKASNTNIAHPNAQGFDQTTEAKH